MFFTHLILTIVLWVGLVFARPTLNRATPQARQLPPPTNYAVVLFPGFEALDVFGPIGALNGLSFNNSMNLFLLSTTLDPVSTKPIRPTLGNSNFSEQILPTHTFDTAPDNIEVLLVPGGVGTREAAPALDRHVAFIKDTYPKLRYIIGVCTGVGLMARTGILDGIPATGNKRAWPWLTSQNYNVKWIAKARWVTHGNIYTTSGVSAGIDGTMAFVKDVYGEDKAAELAKRLEYNRELDSTNDPFADLYNLTDPWVPPTSSVVATPLPTSQLLA